MFCYWAVNTLSCCSTLSPTLYFMYVRLLLSLKLFQSLAQFWKLFCVLRWECCKITLVQRSWSGQWWRVDHIHTQSNLTFLRVQIFHPFINWCKRNLVCFWTRNENFFFIDLLIKVISSLTVIETSLESDEHIYIY